MRFAIVGLGLLAAGIGAAGCKQKSQLVTGLITNLKVKGELTDVTMDLMRNDVLFQQYHWDISDQKALDFVLPGSFTLYSDGGGDPVVQIHVAGFKGDTQKVFRDATLQLAPEQDLFYRMSLVVKCTTGQPNASESCPEGFTCIEGVCKPQVIDNKTLKPYEASRVGSVECDSGTAFFDTSTCSSGTCATIPAGSCAEGEFCSDGTCYSRNPDAPRLLEFGELCDKPAGDACRESGLVCAAAGNGGAPRCRQSCSVDSDCSRRLPDSIAQNIPASNARCSASGSSSTKQCTYACDPLDVVDGGCLSGTICTMIQITNPADPFAPDCVQIPAGFTPPAIGAACDNFAGHCGAGAICLTLSSTAKCRQLCQPMGTPCPGGGTCNTLFDSMGNMSPSWGVCCPAGGCT